MRQVPELHMPRNWRLFFMQLNIPIDLFNPILMQLKRRPPNAAKLNCKPNRNHARGQKVAQNPSPLGVGEPCILFIFQNHACQVEWKPLLPEKEELSKVSQV
jgi:hypothetical protein